MGEKARRWTLIGSCWGVQLTRPVTSSQSEADKSQLFTHKAVFLGGNYWESTVIHPMLYVSWWELLGISGNCWESTVLHSGQCVSNWELLEISGKSTVLHPMLCFLHGIT